MQADPGFTLFTPEIEEKMNTYIKKRKKGVAKYALLPLFLLTFLSFTDAFGAQKVYQNGPFRVRQTGETCKLEVFLESKNLDRSKSRFWKHGFDGETIGFFSVFKTDDYFGELITEGARIGLATGRLSVKFDGVTDRSVVSNDSTGKDSLWKWRHFSYHEDILDRIKRGKRIEVAFSNGENMFHFDISLKNSSKAIRRLKECRGN